MADDVADWLRRLGLEQYAPVFVANDIDGEILPELTPDDLLGLGITSIGHRRKLLAAIAAFRSDAPVAATETAPVPAPFRGVSTVVAPVSGVTRRFCPVLLIIRSRSTVGLKSIPNRVALGSREVASVAFNAATPVVMLIE